MARIGYYTSNIAIDLLPNTLYRSICGDPFSGLAGFDHGNLASRLKYYNKLERDLSGSSFDATLDSISNQPSAYYYDLKEHLRYFGRGLRLNYVFGDVTTVPDRPSFVKSRPVAGDNANSVVLNLDKFRHFYFPEDRTPFADKKPIAVWRGGQHNSRRHALVNNYFHHPLCDVGFTDRRSDESYAKPFLRADKQMRFRYVISIEGVDVATNLKWIMASNSLCIMVAPTYETWFMEGVLQAGRHFVEVRPDCSNLEDKLLYYERHRDEALAIIENAQAHARQFANLAREKLISLLIVYKYYVMTQQLEPAPRLAALLR